MHRTVCKYAKKRVQLYIKRTMDTAFGYKSIDILDISWALHPTTVFSQVLLNAVLDYLEYFESSVG